MKRNALDMLGNTGRNRLTLLVFGKALTVLLTLSGMLFSASVHSAERGAVSPEKRAKARRGKIPSPFRGSLLEYRNVVTTRSFDKNADLTYNPYYAMELHLAPVFMMSADTSLKLDVLMTRELTNSDTTTKEGEVVLDDMYLQTVYSGIPKIPVAGIKITPLLRLYVPSSNISKARTLILGIRPGLSFRRTFKVFKRLTFEWLIRVRKNLHESTTAQSETPLLLPHAGSVRSMESFSNLGNRNVSVGISNLFTIELVFKKRFRALLGMAIAHGFLYEIENKDPRISYAHGEDNRVSYIMTYTGELGYTPTKMKWIELVLGFLTENHQLASDATYETPFFNRHTALFLDVRLDIVGLWSRLSPRGKK